MNFVRKYTLSLRKQKTLTVNGTSNGLGSSQNFFANTAQLLGHGPWPHNSGSTNDVVHGDVTVVLDVLNLLTITWRFFQSLDNQSSSWGHNIDLSLTILNGQLDGNSQAFPILGGLGNVVTNFLGRQTERTDLGGQSGSSSYFSSDGFEDDNLLNENVFTWLVLWISRHGHRNFVTLQIRHLGISWNHVISGANYVIIKKQ